MGELDQKEDIIVEMSNEVDEFLVNLAEKHKEHPLNLSSIVMARLLVLCKATNCLNEFQKIIEDISDDVIPMANTEVTKH